MNETSETTIVLSFKEAFDHLTRGEAIKRAAWQGYWVAEGEDVVMHCKDGSKVSMKNGCLPLFTLNQTIMSDWVVLTPDEQAELDRIHEAHILDKAEDQQAAENSLNSKNG